MVRGTSICMTLNKNGKMQVVGKLDTGCCGAVWRGSLVCALAKAMWRTLDPAAAATAAPSGVKPAASPVSLAPPFLQSWRQLVRSGFLPRTLSQQKQWAPSAGVCQSHTRGPSPPFNSARSRNIRRCGSPRLSTLLSHQARRRDTPTPHRSSSNRKLMQQKGTVLAYSAAWAPGEVGGE